MIEGHLVIDFHGHVGRWDDLGFVDDQSAMLLAMDAVGIDRSCVFNIFHPEGSIGNNETAVFVARHPNRFIGFAYVSPLLPDLMVPELERAVDELGFRAIKLYPPYTSYPLNHPAWDPIYAFANERALAVLAHTGSGEASEPRHLREAARRFSKASFVAGHAGNFEPYRSQAIKVAQDCPNVYLETCSTFRNPGLIEELVDRVGAERVLFGSDTPLMDPRPQIGKIITAAIDNEAKGLILGENARRLLNL